VTSRLTMAIHEELILLKETGTYELVKPHAGVRISGFSGEKGCGWKCGAVHCGGLAKFLPSTSLTPSPLSLSSHLEYCSRHRCQPGMYLGFSRCDVDFFRLRARTLLCMLIITATSISWALFMDFSEHVEITDLGDSTGSWDRNLS
jgi:hypothetical protein